MSLTISLVGDIMLGRTFRLIDNNAPSPYSQTVLNIFNTSDLVMGNLETTITDSVGKIPGKTFHFRMKPKHIYWFKPFHYLSIANNHILDYGLNGLYDTMNILKKNSIFFTGAGMNKTEALKMATIYTNGYSIGIISATDHYEEWNATTEKYGVNYIDPQDLSNSFTSTFISDIKKQSKQVDILIVYLHWGPNYIKTIPDWMKNFGRILLDNGALIVAGTSPHHILPIEKYKNGVIFYSLGDFIDDYAIDPYYRNDIGMIGLVKISKGKIKVNYIPTLIKKLRTVLL